MVSSAMASSRVITTPGLQTLTRLFPSTVRTRAESYIGQGAVKVVVNTLVTLVAQVQGGERYVTCYGRAGKGINYACSCPYFMDRRSPCKHLYALAVEEADALLFRDAASVRHIRAQLDLLRRVGAIGGLESIGERFEELDGEDDELDSLSDDATDEEPTQAIVGLLRHSGDEGDWRSVVASVDARVGREGRPQVELLYFLTPSLVEFGSSVVIAARRLAAAEEDFAPFTQPASAELVHADDRELIGLLSSTYSADAYYTGARPYRARLLSHIAPLVLERLAKSGRCYLVPRSLPRAQLGEWSSLSDGQRVSRRDREQGTYDFAQLLTWPKLTMGSGEELKLALELLESAAKHGTKRRKRVFDVRAFLLQGEEQRELDSVSYVDREGLVIHRSELVRLNRGDARWLSAIAQHGLGRVKEDELPDFVEHVFGKYGVSALSLPASYQQVALEPPRPVLDLETPTGRKLRGSVTFDYDGRRVTTDHQSPLIVELGRVMVRHRESERSALALLDRLGFRGELLGNGRVPGVGIDQKDLPVAVRALLEAGWLVQAAGKRYRSAGRFDIEVESGIDWFEIKGTAQFDGGEAPFPRLLAAIKRRSSVVQLGDGSWGVLPEEWLRRWGLFAELPATKGDSLRFSSKQIGLVHALCAALPEDVAARGLRALRDRLARFQTVSPARAPRGFAGSLRPYQEEGLGWLLTLGELGFWCLPRRRHGSRQDSPGSLTTSNPEAKRHYETGADCRSAFTARQLVGRGCAVYTRALGSCVLGSRAPTQQGSVCRRRRRAHHVRHAATGYRVAEPGRARCGRSRRSTGDQEQEQRHRQVRQAAPRRAARGHERHTYRKPSRRALVAVRISESRSIAGAWRSATCPREYQAERRGAGARAHARTAIRLAPYQRRGRKRTARA